MRRPKKEGVVKFIFFCDNRKIFYAIFLLSSREKYSVFKGYRACCSNTPARVSTHVRIITIYGIS